MFAGGTFLLLLCFHRSGLFGSGLFGSLIGAVGSGGFSQGSGGGGGILLGLPGSGARFASLCALGRNLFAKACEIALGLAQRFDAGTAGGFVVTFCSGSGSRGGGGFSDMLPGTTFEAFELSDMAGQLIGGGAEANRFLFLLLVIGDRRFVSFADGLGFGNLSLLGIGGGAHLISFSLGEAVGLGLGFLCLAVDLGFGFLCLAVSFGLGFLCLAVSFGLGFLCLGLGFLSLATFLGLGFLRLATFFGGPGAGFLAFFASKPVLFCLHLLAGGGEVLAGLSLLCLYRGGLFGSSAIDSFIRAIGGFRCSQSGSGSGSALLGPLGGAGNFADLLPLGRKVLVDAQEIAFGLAQRFDAGTAGGLVVVFSSGSSSGSGICYLLPGTALEGFELGNSTGQLVSVGTEAARLPLLAVVIGECRFVSFT